MPYAKITLLLVRVSREGIIFRLKIGVGIGAIAPLPPNNSGLWGELPPQIIYSLYCHFTTSNTPRVVIFTLGITGRLKNDSVINGSISRLTPKE